jgi:hypothetical protein
LEITDLFCWLLKKGEEFGKRIAEWIKNADYCKGMKRRGISSFGYNTSIGLKRIKKLGD